MKKVCLMFLTKEIDSPKTVFLDSVFNDSRPNENISEAFTSVATDFLENN